MKARIFSFAAFTLVWIAFVLAAGASSPSNAETLLVMSRRGSDAEQFKARLAQQGFTVIREARCKTYQYSIFEVLPNSGDAPAALRSLHAAKDADLAVAEMKFDSVLSSCTPDINDPDFDEQWHLQAMNFDEMHCLLDAHGVKQTRQPRITLVDSGIQAIKKEMNKGQIREFSFVGGVNGVEDDVFIDGVANQHGTAVTSVVAATTNNGKFLASVPSIDKQAKITMCRVAENDAIETMDVLDAMVWCVDNQAVRGGPGAINLSINSTELPTYNGSSIVQEIARDAYKQSDLFVNGAGNTNFEDPSPKTKHFRILVGLDETDMRWDEGEGVGSVYGEFKAATPCTDIPYLISSGKSDFDVFHGTGTSFAAPCWASCISLLMSLDPNLTAPKADKILFKTAQRTVEGYHLPDLRNAVNKVLELEP